MMTAIVKISTLSKPISKRTIGVLLSVALFFPLYRFPSKLVHNIDWAPLVNTEFHGDRFTFVEMSPDGPTTNVDPRTIFSAR